MGNKAVITDKHKKIGIYLHWNGGRDSIEGFLTFCKIKQYRDGVYGFARLVQAIGNFLGGGLSVGIGVYESIDIDNGDNGTYIIEDWEIIGREYFNGEEEKEYDLKEFVESINSSFQNEDKLKQEDIDNYFKKEIY